MRRVERNPVDEPHTQRGTTMKALLQAPIAEFSSSQRTLADDDPSFGRRYPQAVQSEQRLGWLQKNGRIVLGFMVGVIVAILFV